jgi:hypothetical protein
MTVKNININSSEETKSAIISAFLSDFQNEVPNQSFVMAYMNTCVIVKTEGSTPVASYTIDSDNFSDTSNTSRSAMLTVIESHLDSLIPEDTTDKIISVIHTTVFE